MQKIAFALIADEKLFPYFHTLLQEHFILIRRDEKLSAIEESLTLKKVSFILMQINVKTEQEEISRAKQIMFDLGIPVLFLHISFYEGAVDYMTFSYPDVTIVKPVTAENVKKSIDTSLMNFKNMIESTSESERLKYIKQHLKRELKKHTNNHRTVIPLDTNCVYNNLEKTLYHNNRKITFSKKETLLLDLLIKHIGSPVTYEMIETVVWDGKSTLFSTIRSLVRRIRSKACADLIITLPGIGYRLENKT